MSDHLKDLEDPEEHKENSRIKSVEPIKILIEDISDNQNQIEALTKKINELESINKQLSRKIEEINASNLEKQIINFKQKIGTLENEKKVLIEKNKEFEAKQEYVGFLEKEVSQMENIIESLQTSVQNLEEENKIIGKSFEDSDIQELEVEGQISEIRRACPKCGNNNPSQIREMTDKTNIISFYPKVYGMKYQCGQCGTEWHKK